MSAKTPSNGDSSTRNAGLGTFCIVLVVVILAIVICFGSYKVSNGPPTPNPTLVDNNLQAPTPPPSTAPAAAPLAATGAPAVPAETAPAGSTAGATPIPAANAPAAAAPGTAPASAGQ